MRRSIRLRGDDGTDDDDMDDWSLAPGGSGTGINIVARHVTVVTGKPPANNQIIVKRNQRRSSNFDNPWRQWKEVETLTPNDTRKMDYTSLEDELPPYYLCGPAPEEAYTMPPYEVKHTRRSRQQPSWARNESLAGGGRMGHGPLPALVSHTPQAFPQYNHPSHSPSSARNSNMSQLSSSLPSPPRRLSTTPFTTQLFTYCRPDTCCPKLDIVSAARGQEMKANVQYQQCPAVNSSKTFLVVPLRLRRKDDEAIVRTAGAVARAVDASSVVVVRQQRLETDTGEGKRPSNNSGATPPSHNPSRQPPMPPPPPTPTPAETRQPPKYTNTRGTYTEGGGKYGYKNLPPPDSNSLVGPKGDATSTPISDIPPDTGPSTPAQTEALSLIFEKPSIPSLELTTVGTQYSDIETEPKSKSSVSKLHSETNETERPMPRRGMSPQSKKVHSQFTITSTIEECDCHEEMKDSKPHDGVYVSPSSSCSSSIPLALPCVFATSCQETGPDSKTGDAHEEQAEDDNNLEGDDVTNSSDQLPSTDDLGPLANALREALRLCTQLQSNCMDESSNPTPPNKVRRALGGGDSPLDSAQEQNISSECQEAKSVDVQTKEVAENESKKSLARNVKKSSTPLRRHEQFQKLTQLRQWHLDHLVILRKRLQEQQRRRALKVKKLKEMKENEEHNEEKEVVKEENDNKQDQELIPPETTHKSEETNDLSNMPQETKSNNGEEKELETQEEKINDQVSFEPEEENGTKDEDVKESTEERDDEEQSDEIHAGRNTETKSQSTTSDSIRDESEEPNKKKRVKSVSLHSSKDEETSNYLRPPTPYYPWRSTNIFDHSPTRPVLLETRPDEDKSQTSPDLNSGLSDIGDDKGSSVIEVYTQSSSQSSKEEYKPGTPTLTFFGKRPPFSEHGSTPPHSIVYMSEPQWIPVHSTKETLKHRSSSAFAQSASRKVLQLVHSSRPSSEFSRASSHANSSTPVSSSILHHTSTENIYQKPLHWPSPFPSQKPSIECTSVEQLKNYSRANTLSSSSISSECILNNRSLDLAPSRRTTPTGLPSQLSVARSNSFVVEMTSTDRLVAEISNEIGSLPPSTDTTISLREATNLLCYSDGPDAQSRMVDRHRLLCVQHGEQIWDQVCSKRGPRSVRGGRSKTRGRGLGRNRGSMQVRWLLPPTPPRGSKPTSTATQDPLSTQTSNPPVQHTAAPRASTRPPVRTRSKKHSKSTGLEKNHLGKSALRLLPQNGNDKWSLRAVTTTTMVSGSVRSGARPSQRNGGPRWRSTRPSPSPVAPSSTTYSPLRAPHQRSSSQPHVERTKERHSLARTSRSSRSPAPPQPGAPKRRTSVSRPPPARSPSVNGGRCAPRAAAAFSRINTLQQLQKRIPTKTLLRKVVGKDMNNDTLVSNFHDSSGQSLSTDGFRAVIQEVTNKPEGLQMRPDCGEGSPVASRSPFRKPEELISQIMIEASAAANANSCVRSKVKCSRSGDCRKREREGKKEKTSAEGGDMKITEPPPSAHSSVSGKATSVNTQTSYLDLPLQIPTPLKIPGLAGCVRSKTEKLLQELIERNSARDMPSGTMDS